MPKTPAWTRKEGKDPKGGLNAKGRASYNKANPGRLQAEAVPGRMRAIYGEIDKKQERNSCHG